VGHGVRLKEFIENHIKKMDFLKKNQIDKLKVLIE
jgi:hypothetical protein